MSAGTLLVLSVVVAGLQQAGTARPTATLHAAQPREAALATSSLSGGVSSEQATLDDVNQRLAAAADAAETQRWELVSAFLKAVRIRPAPSAPAAAPAAALPPAPSGGPGQRALAAAEAELGKPYSYGGAGPGSFDCSGLTMFAWRAAGVSLPHSASDQYASTTHVPLSSLQPGDLLFFGSSGGIGHVSMYVSPGRMIEAEDSGTVVSINPIRSDLVGASRP